MKDVMKTVLGWIADHIFWILVAIMVIIKLAHGS